MRTYLKLTLLALPVFPAGCSGKYTPVPVGGVVTLDSKPVENATINFYAVGDDREGRPAFGQTDKAGALVPDTRQAWCCVNRLRTVGEETQETHQTRPCVRSGGGAGSRSCHQPAGIPEVLRSKDRSSHR